MENGSREIRAHEGIKAKPLLNQPVAIVRKIMAYAVPNYRAPGTESDKNDIPTRLACLFGQSWHYH